MPGVVKLGFIGCGMMGQCVHLPSFHKVKNAEIVALADLRPKLARAVAERWKIRKVYSSHLEMAEDKEIDAIVEITNKFVHAPIAIDALKAGKHVFTEKPIATNSKDAADMVKTAQKHGAKLMVGYMKRYDSGVLRAKQIFEEFARNDKVTYVRSHLFGGDWICGPTAEVVIESGEPYPRTEPRYPDFLPPKLVETMNNMLEQIHDINLPRFFLGDPVACDSFRSWASGFMAFLDYGDFPCLLEMGSITADFWEEQLLICFKNGWIDLRPPAPLLRNVPTKVHVYRAGNVQKDEYPHGTWSWPFEAEAQHFVDCIVADREPVSSGLDSYKDIVVIESILRSAMEGRRILMEFSL